MSRDNGKVPSLPFSEDSEKGLLCSLLLEPGKVMKLCADRISCNAFYIPANRIIYETIPEWPKPDDTVDFIWLKKALKDRNQLEEVGGLEYLSPLYSFVPTAANASYYIGIVREQYALRRVVIAAAKISEQSANADIKAVLADLEPDISEIVHGSNGDETISPIESGTDLLKAELALPSELIKGLFHKTLKGQLAAGSKSMKSWALIHLAIAVSLGLDWWGFKTTRGRVLFINLEIPRAFFRERISQVICAMEASLDPKTFSVVHLRGSDLSRPKVWDEIVAKIVRSGPWDLLVFDPVYKILGSRDENSATDVTQIVMSLERAAELTGAAVLYSHHYAKGSAALKESTDRMSGSGVWMRDPDTYLAMTRHEVEDCFVIEPTLRNLPAVKPFVMRWRHPLFERAPELDPEQLRQPKRTGAVRFRPEQIVEALGFNALKTAELQKVVTGETGMSRSKFFDLLHDAERRKLIFKDGQTNTWERPSTNNGRNQN